MNYDEKCKTFEKTFPFWDKITQAERDSLVNHTSLVSYKKNQNIHGNRGVCTGAVFVKRGIIRVYLISEEGREITLYRLYEGDICMLSSSCVIQSISFDVFVDAEADSDVYIVNPSSFDKIIKNNIYAENYALSIVAARFSSVMWTLQQVLFMSFDKRLANFLLDEYEKSKNPVIKYTHQEIAKYLGSAREVVSRMLKYFSLEKLVNVSRGGIELIDIKGLKHIIT